MAAKKKATPPRRGSTKGRGSSGGRTKRSRDGAGKIDEKAAAKVPKNRTKGKRLTVGQQNLRDTLMLTRIAQGWTMPAIAEEAGVSVSTAEKAIKRRRDEYPLVLSIDPVRVVEEITLGLQLSIGDLQSLAHQAVQTNNVAAAVGAVKGANDARAQVIGLLQDVGRLPKDLSSLRHLLELRDVGQRMAVAVRTFREEVAGLEIEEAARAELDSAAADVERVFVDLIDPPKPGLESAA